MIYESLIVPTERPPTLLEIKRALITFDKVIVVDPDDRDMMPSNALMSLIMGFPLMGFDAGPVRPMAKEPAYDDQVTSLLEACASAVRQGIIRVESTYDRAATRNLTIGGVPTGGYPLNMSLVFSLYRSMAGDQGFLEAAVRRDVKTPISTQDGPSNLALSGHGDSAINNIPGLPTIESDLLPPDHLVPLTQIARARIGAFIKYCGYCEMKNVVPLLGDEAYGSITECVVNNANAALDVGEDDPFWARRRRVLELIHEEYLLDQRLEALSVDQVLRLRTKAWGKQAEAREALFSSVFSIATDATDKEAFEHRAASQIAEYRKTGDALLNERTNLGFRIKCELGEAALAGTGSIAGLLSQTESPLASVGLTMVAGGIWALSRAKDYVPALREIRQRETEMKRGAGFGLYNFYTRIGI